MVLYQLFRCSLAKSCPTLYDPMDCSTPGLPLLHYLPEFELMSIELVMPSSHLILCCPILLPPIPPSIRVFSNESFLHMRWPKYWSFSFSISLPVNTQDCSPLGWTCWISLQSKGLSRVFSNTTVLKHQWLVGELKIFIVTYEVTKSQTWLSDWAELMSILAKGKPTIMTGS